MKAEHVQYAEYFRDVLGAQIIPLWGIKQVVWSELSYVCEYQCRCELGAECTSPGKHPIYRWRDQRSRLPSSIDNWGYASDRIVVLDFDSPEAGVPFPLPGTWRINTRRGHHLIYSWTGAPIRTKIGAWSKVDVKASGSLIVGPGSMCVDGSRYMPANSDPITPLPQMIADIIGTMTTAHTKLPARTIAADTYEGCLPSLERYMDEIRASQTRNTDLFTIACRLYREGWCGQDGFAMLAQAALDAGLSVHEVQRTMDSAYGSVFQ